MTYITRMQIDYIEKQLAHVITKNIMFP
jgi:hypothetical protein